MRVVHTFIDEHDAPEPVVNLAHGVAVGTQGHTAVLLPSHHRVVLVQHVVQTPVQAFQVLQDQDAVLFHVQDDSA